MPLIDLWYRRGWIRHLQYLFFAALIAAAADFLFAKHGNRAISSKSGSADFFQALGSHRTKGGAGNRIFTKHRFAFLIAPIYHEAMKHAAPVRRDIGIRPS